MKTTLKELKKLIRFLIKEQQTASQDDQDTKQRIQNLKEPTMANLNFIYDKLTKYEKNNDIMPQSFRDAKKLILKIKSGNLNDNSLPQFVQTLGMDLSVPDKNKDTVTKNWEILFYYSLAGYSFILSNNPQKCNKCLFATKRQIEKMQNSNIF